MFYKYPLISTCANKGKPLEFCALVKTTSIWLARMVIISTHKHGAVTSGNLIVHTSMTDSN